MVSENFARYPAACCEELHWLNQSNWINQSNHTNQNHQPIAHASRMSRASVSLLSCLCRNMREEGYLGGRLPNPPSLQARRPAPTNQQSCLNQNPSLQNRFVPQIRSAPGHKTKTPDPFVRVSAQHFDVSRPTLPVLCCRDVTLDHPLDFHCSGIICTLILTRWTGWTW